MDLSQSLKKIRNLQFNNVPIIYDFSGLYHINYLTGTLFSL
ncbi:hypothetical protein GXM_02560 [Nostoc sphaeroides CCNUC1]|uniref:Uncharacterized protein n=1 Tax=Nostoc sphaeroides CCNUC1 TaxID=2653204 RepID=A0A5P8VXE6_9NOSO|nr:hypothetical protein GXM_02560 [Nostoc sphaeroides CCNUC1]